MKGEGLIFYIRGFCDAEGGLPKDPISAKQKYLSFDQKNKELLVFIRNILITFGFRPTNLTYTSSVWQFRLTRKEDIKKFYIKFSSCHPDKYSRLYSMVCLFSPELAGAHYKG